MSFTEYRDKARHRTNEAYLSLGPSNTGYLTVAAIQAYYGSVTEITYLTDISYSKLGIYPGQKAPSSQTYSLIALNGGASISLTTVLHEYGIRMEAIETTHRLPLTPLTEDRGFPVVDLTPLIIEYTNATVCPECGRRCKNENGLKTHHGRVHDSLKKTLEDLDPDTIGGPTPSGDDSWQDLQENQAATESGAGGGDA